MIRLIAALDSKRGIATDSGIPWTLPDDSTHFVDETTSGLILMGWVTYSEFAAPLHGRVNYVITTSLEPLREGFQPVGGLEQLRADHVGEDVWVIGGAAVFARAIVEADELVLTQVFADFGCTKFFPPYREDFVMSSSEADREHGDVTFRFETWERRTATR